MESSPSGAFARDMSLQQEVESLLREASSHGFTFDAKAVFDAVTGTGGHSFSVDHASHSYGSGNNGVAAMSAPYVSDETLDPTAAGTSRDASRATGVGSSSSLAGDGEGGSIATGGSSVEHFFHWLEKRNAKREALKAQLSQERSYEPECTFSPNMAASKRTFQGSQVSKALLDRMYDWSRRRKMKLTQAVQQVRKEATSECTFTPRITKMGHSAQSRLPEEVRKVLASPGAPPQAKWDRDLLDDATKKQLEARQAADASAFMARMNAGREKARRINEIVDIKITTGAKYTGKITIPEGPALATSSRSRVRSHALGGSTALTQPAASRVIGGGGSTWKRPSLRDTMAAMRAEEEYRAMAEGRAPDPQVWGGSVSDYYGEEALAGEGGEEEEAGQEGGYYEGEGDGSSYYYGGDDDAQSSSGYTAASAYGAGGSEGEQAVYVAPPGAPLPPGAIPLYVIPPEAAPPAAQYLPPTPAAAAPGDPFAALAELQRMYGQAPTPAPAYARPAAPVAAAAASAAALDVDLAKEAALAAMAGQAPLGAPDAATAAATQIRYTVSASRPGTVVVGTGAVPAVAAFGAPPASPAPPARPAPPPAPDVDTALLNVLSAYGVPAQQAAAAASPAPLTPRAASAASSKLSAASPFLRQDLPGLARSGDPDPLLRHLAVLKAAEEVKRNRQQAAAMQQQPQAYHAYQQQQQQYYSAGGSSPAPGPLSVRELYAALPQQQQQHFGAPQPAAASPSVMVVRAGPQVFARL